MRKLIIGVDFDGTIVEHDYPDIGVPVPGALETMRECVKRGADLILWTMRSGQDLDEATAFLSSHGVKLFGVNSNPETNWTSSPKAYCHIYVDDAALGCPLIHRGDPLTGERPMVDWSKVAPVLFAMIEARKPCGS